MADIAAYLVDQLLPEAAYRQWVLTFPWTLRFRLAVDRPLFSALLRAFLLSLFAWQRRRGRALGITGGQTGAVTFVQRFGGALNLHPHVHCLVPDGLLVPDPEGGSRFAPLPPPTTEEVEHLLSRIARRLTRVVERHSADEFETAELLHETVAALRRALASAVKPPLPSFELEPTDTPAVPKPLCAKLAGFTLHAAQAVEAHDRSGLERLCRYGLRAPFSQERLTRRADGRVVYHLRRPWPHPQGAACLVLEPHDLLQRLAALLPAPYTHLVRYHGVFASRSAMRRRLPAPPDALEREGPATPPPGGNEAQPGLPSEAGRQPSSRPPRSRRCPLSWAKLLMRVFFIQALRCPRCSEAMLVLALISDPPVVAKILRHLGLPTQVPPPAPARQSGYRDPLGETHAPDGTALVESDPARGHHPDERDEDGNSPHHHPRHPP